MNIDINELRNMLEKAGFDTTEITEEDLKNIAQQISTKITPNNYNISAEQLKKILDNNVGKRIKKVVPAPTKIIVGGNKFQKPQAMAPRPNNGLNYTGERKSGSGLSKDNQPEEQQPASATNEVSYAGGNSTTTNNQTPGRNAAGFAANQNVGRKAAAGKALENKKGQTNKTNEGAKPNDEGKNAKPPKAIKYIAGKVDNISNPKFDENGNAKEPLPIKITEENTGSKSEESRQKTKQNSVPSAPNKYSKPEEATKDKFNIVNRIKRLGRTLRKNVNGNVSAQAEGTAEADSQKIANNNNTQRFSRGPLSRLRNILRGKSNTEDETTGSGSLGNLIKNGLGEKAKKILKNKAMAWIAANLPIILPIVGIIILVALLLIIIFIIIFGFLGDGDSNSSSTNSNEVATGAQTTCSYNLDQNTIENVKVELINCHGKKSDYKVLATVDFEKYVLGVSLAEIGENAPDESLKAQIVAARTYALSRNKGMCPGNPDSCFYGYNKDSNTIRMRACEADQVYWDYEKDTYRLAQGPISLYSPEVDSTSGRLWKRALSAEKKQHVESVAATVKGQILTDKDGSPLRVSYKSNDQQTMMQEANAGKKYDEILKNKYGVTPSSSNCRMGNMEYNNYQLDNDNSGILHLPLSSFLASKGTSLDAFNQLIDSNVKKAGYGTRAAVVSAAVTLIGELGNKYNVKVPYYWGGGHGAPDNLANGNWGSTACHTYANGQSYNYCGLDCSGFVGWAIYNGGYKNVTRTAESYVNISGARDVGLGSSSLLMPGDLLYNSYHVILIVGVDRQSGAYECAEAKGNAYGVLFSKHSFDGDGGKYRGVDMSGFYQNNANVR